MTLPGGHVEGRNVFQIGDGDVGSAPDQNITAHFLSGTGRGAQRGVTRQCVAGIDVNLKDHELVNNLTKTKQLIPKKSLPRSCQVSIPRPLSFRLKLPAWWLAGQPRPG